MGLHGAPCEPVPVPVRMLLIPSVLLQEVIREIQEADRHVQKKVFGRTAVFTVLRGTAGLKEGVVCCLFGGAQQPEERGGRAGAVRGAEGAAVGGRSAGAHAVQVRRHRRAVRPGGQRHLRPLRRRQGAAAAHYYRALVLRFSRTLYAIRTQPSPPVGKYVFHPFPLHPWYSWRSHASARKSLCTQVTCWEKGTCQCSVPEGVPFLYILRRSRRWRGTRRRWRGPSSGAAGCSRGAGTPTPS